MSVDAGNLASVQYGTLNSISDIPDPQAWRCSFQVCFIF